MRNSNMMIRPSSVEFNPHVIGGKTGFTNAAQHTLVTYAEKDGREIIISVLYASPRDMIFSDTAALIDFAFNELFLEEILEDVFEVAPEEPSDEIYDESETAPVFAPLSEIEKIADISPASPPVSLSVSDEVSDSRSALSASLSVAFVAVALVGLALLKKKYYN